jgi:hypothetical protein
MIAACGRRENELEKRSRVKLYGIVSFVLVAGIYFYPTVKRWQASAQWIADSTEKNLDAGNSHVRVWASRRSGFYYCPHTEWYGKMKPGFYVTQTRALQSGYRPALGQACE